MEKMKSYYLTKEESTLLNGLAIVFVVIEYLSWLALKELKYREMKMYRYCKKSGSINKGGDVLLKAEQLLNDNAPFEYTREVSDVPDMKKWETLNSVNMIII